MRAAILALFPGLALAAPRAIQARDTASCTPNAFIVDEYSHYTALHSSANPAHALNDGEVSFTLTSYLSQVGQAPIHCTATSTAPGGTFSSDTLYQCDGTTGTGFYVLPDKSVQLIAQWSCDGHPWMASTRVQPSLACAEVDNGSAVGTSCKGPESFFVTPQNVRQICNTPTCP